MSQKRPASCGDDPAEFWDTACLTHGHTGWADQLIYRWDQPLRRRAVARVIDNLHPTGLSGVRALDVGCGAGDFVAMAAGRGGKAVGLDISSRVVEKARARFAGVPNVRIARGSVTDLPFVAGSFQLVTSITVLQHLVQDADLERALAGLHRVLVPSGKLIALELSPNRRQAVVAVGQPVIERPHAEWLRGFAQAGFDVVSESVYPQLGTTLVRGMARLLDSLRARGFYHSSLTTKQGSAAAGHHGGVRVDGDVSSRRRLARNVLQGARSVLLAVAAPIDHVAFVPIPSSWRYYRLFVLARR